MLRRFEREYRDVRKEVIRIQDCVTEYLKMFFGVCAGVVGAVLYIASNFTHQPIVDPTTPASQPQTAQYSAKIDGGHSLAAQYSATIDGGYAFAAISFIIVAFASILFHKFNSHNRYSGYARAIEREVQTDTHGNKSNISDQENVYLWESTLGGIHSQSQVDVREDAVVSAHIRKIDSKYNYGFRNLEQIKCWLWFARCGFRGSIMIMRAGILREKTKSWTYPFQVAFSLAVPAMMVIFVWLRYSVMPGGWGIDKSIQIVMLFSLLICWLGLCHRLYRLSADDGDRTIEAYTYRSMLHRKQALKERDIFVTYI